MVESSFSKTLGMSINCKIILYLTTLYNMFHYLILQTRTGMLHKVGRYLVSSNKNSWCMALSRAGAMANHKC